VWFYCVVWCLSRVCDLFCCVWVVFRRVCFCVMVWDVPIASECIWVSNRAKEPYGVLFELRIDDTAVVGVVFTLSPSCGYRAIPRLFLSFPEAVPRVPGGLPWCPVGQEVPTDPPHSELPRRSHECADLSWCVGSSMHLPVEVVFVWIGTVFANFVVVRPSGEFYSLDR
jgi:hypothetical protein